MRLIKPSFEIMGQLDGMRILSNLESAGRTCYKSEGNTTDDGGSAIKLIKSIIDLGHESVLEHESISVRFICNRGFTHELVRHRLCAYSQESTRYCNYSAEKFGGHITFIIPPWVNIRPGEYSKASRTNAEIGSKDYYWADMVAYSELTYQRLTEFGCKPEEARGVLPIDLKTEIVCTANIREWRHILKLRTSNRAHPQMRELMIPLLTEFQDKILVVFDDIGV